MCFHVGVRHRNFGKIMKYFRTPPTPFRRPYWRKGRGGGSTMIVLGEGRPVRTSLGIFCLGSHTVKYLPLTLVGGGSIAFCPPPPCGGPPSVGPLWTVCYGG